MTTTKKITATLHTTCGDIEVTEWKEPGTDSEHIRVESIDSSTYVYVSRVSIKGYEQRAVNVHTFGDLTDLSDWGTSLRLRFGPDEKHTDVYLRMSVDDLIAALQRLRKKG